jgi:CBS domain-containing protein
MTVLEALQAMSDHNVGAMPVLEGQRLLGVFSERDYARKIVLKGRHSNDTPVREVMTREVVTVGPDETLENCMCLMNEKHIRHLPVVEEGNLVSHFSIRDLMQWMIDTQKHKIDHLQNYIEGSGYGR